jgi:hypothetical protein
MVNDHWLVPIMLIVAYISPSCSAIVDAERATSTPSKNAYKDSWIVMSGGRIDPHASRWTLDQRTCYIEYQAPGCKIDAG